MRDTIAAEANGLPAVLAVIGWLDSIAQETRRVAGMREVPIVAIEQSFFGRSREEITGATRAYASRIVDSITAPADSITGPADSSSAPADPSTAPD